MLVPRVYQSNGGRPTLIVLAMPTLPHLLEVVCERLWLEGISIGGYSRDCGAGAGPSVLFLGTKVISSSESSVNNWWESDGPMKGIYQGNEFDLEGPPCKFFFGAILTETARKS